MRTEAVGTAILLVLLGLAGSALAVDYASVQNGNWSSPATWTPSGVPGASDNATISHQVTVDGTSSVNNITIGASGTLVIAGAYTLQVYGNWTNNGSVALTNGAVHMVGSAPAVTIGGSSATAFYVLEIRKASVNNVVNLGQSVSVTYNGQYSFSLGPYVAPTWYAGTVNTNGYNLNLNGGNGARAFIGSNTALNVSGGTVEVQSVYHACPPSTVNVTNGATFNVRGGYTLYNSGCRFNLTGGTVNFLSTSTGLYLATNYADGFCPSAGEVNFHGGVSDANYQGSFRASGTAVIRFVGSQNAVVRLRANTGYPTSVWNFNDLRVEKTGGATVTITNPTIAPQVGSVTASVGVTVNAGAALNLNGPFDDGYGYDFENVANNGTIAQSADRVHVYGDWTGTGTFSHGGKGVTFDGTGDRTVALGGGSFNDLTLNKTSGSLALGSDLVVESDLVVTSGTFAVGENALTLGTASAAGNVDVNGGKLTAVGSAFGRSAVAAADPAYPYSFDVAAPAAIGARLADFSGMDAAGINVAGGVDATDNFSYCTFDHGTSPGAMLTIANGQVIDDMTGVDFSGSAGDNIDYRSGTGHITVVGGAGTRWGEDFDNDPLDLVDWPTLPGAFSLAEPGDGAVDQPVTGIAFDWGDAAGNPAPTYDLYLGTDPQNPPPEPPVKAGLTASEWTYDLPTPLANKTDYYWNVKARNEHGEAWSDNGNYRFRTIVAAPGGFALLVPEDGATGVALSGELVWQAASDVDRYTVFLGTSEASPDSITDVSGTSYSYSGLEYRTDYYWTVVAKNVAGRTPTVSGTWQFRTQGAVPEWPAGWKEMKSVPTGTAAVKDGGLLVTAPDKEPGEQPVVYAAKGNKSTEFYKYYAVEDSWFPLAAINPDEGGRPKPPKKGCAAATDGERNIYMTKGNNTLGFWRYDIQKDSWYRLADVPAGPDGKKVKGGTDLAYVAGNSDTGWVYLLKGYKTEFYRYNTASGYWDTLDNLPYGGAPKYNAGSFLVYDNAGTIYAHQAKYTNSEKTRHYMYQYDLAAQAWIPEVGAKGMPVLGMDGGKMKNKKAKDGGAGAWYDGSIYALKGGNTCQFYRYDPSPGDTWTELDTIKSFGTTAKKKKVKAGGDLTSYGFGAFFALKGNKTYEMWRYVIPSGAQAQARSGVAADGRLQNADCRMQIAPNPLNSGYATINYSLPKAGPVSVTIVDVAGRSVFSTRTLGHLTAGTLPLDLRVLSAGVYLVRLDADGHTQSQKLVVQR